MEGSFPTAGLDPEDFLHFPFSFHLPEMTFKNPLRSTFLSFLRSFFLRRFSFLNFFSSPNSIFFSTFSSAHLSSSRFRFPHLCLGPVRDPGTSGSNYKEKKQRRKDDQKHYKQDLTISRLSSFLVERHPLWRHFIHHSHSSH